MGGGKGGGGAGSEALNALAATQSQIAGQLMPLTSMQIADQMAFQFGEDYWQPDMAGGGGQTMTPTPTGAVGTSAPGMHEVSLPINLGEYGPQTDYTFEMPNERTSWADPETGETWRSTFRKKPIEETFAAPLLVSPQNPAYAAARERMLESMPAGGALESALGQYELGFARERDLARQVATSALMGTPPALGGMSTAWGAPASAQAAGLEMQQAQIGQQGLAGVGNLLGTGMMSMALK